MEEELINSIAKKFNLDIQQINEGHQIKIYNKSKFYCKIDIGTDALEWYITLVEKSSNDIIYEDWMDYLGYDERKEIDLIKDKLNPGFYVCTLYVNQKKKTLKILVK